MNAEFNWWLLIVGLVLGAGLVWLVLADGRRRDVDVPERERATEARWIAEAMADAGRTLDDDEILEVLRLHHEYLGLGPPDDLLDEPEAPPDRWVTVTDRPARAGSPSSAETLASGEAPAPPAEPPDADRDGDLQFARPPVAHPLPRPDDAERRVSEG